MGRSTSTDESQVDGSTPAADDVDPHTWPTIGHTDAGGVASIGSTDAPLPTTELAQVDAVAKVDHEGPIPAGTPVVAVGGQVGEVLSYDPITQQVQISFVNGGRGWFNHRTVSTDVDGLSVAE